MARRNVDGLTLGAGDPWTTGANFDTSPNPDAGGIGGLFSEAANWIGSQASGIADTAASYFAFDRAADLEEARINAGREAMQPTRAEGGQGGAAARQSARRAGFPTNTLWIIAAGVLAYALIRRI